MLQRALRRQVIAKQKPSETNVVRQSTANARGGRDWPRLGGLPLTG